MEWTARSIVGSAFLESHEVTYNLFNSGCVNDLIYSFVRNHIQDLLFVHLIVYLFKLHILHIVDMCSF